MQTIAEAKKHLRANFDKGTQCPCCGQFVKLYKFSMHHKMAHWLIELVKEFEETNDWCDHRRITLKTGMISGDYAKLLHWGLVEKNKNKEDKRSSGKWKPTDLGIKFARGSIKVPKKVFLFNQKCFGKSDEKVNVIDVLGKYFDYNELMEN